MFQEPISITEEWTAKAPALVRRPIHRKILAPPASGGSTGDRSVQVTGSGWAQPQACFQDGAPITRVPLPLAGLELLFALITALNTFRC